MSTSHPVIDHARPDELGAAFALVFGRLDPRHKAARVAHAVALVGSGELDPAGVFVAREREAVVGALICATVPGAGSLIWPPGAGTAACEDALVARGCAWVRERGARLTQCLLDEDRVGLAQPLLRAGLAYVTHLTYLDHDLSLPVDVLSTPSRAKYDRYDQCPEVFGEVLLRTYDQTLDCPEVEGVRALEEVLEGHRAQGRSGAANWWVARAGGRPVGVLILADLGDEWELAYMGVVPEARRGGVGREMLLHALCEARAAGAAGLTLCVDERNEPAWRLYRKVGMRERDRRAVFLRVWGAAGDGRGHDGRAGAG